MNFVEELKWRGLIHQCTDIDGLSSLIDNTKITVFCGFDPTADSLHIGHLIPMISLLRFVREGHNGIALVGGATGLIGDPSGKSQEREVLHTSTVQNNCNSIAKQLSLITKSKVVNNMDWFCNMSVIDFMRNVGKNFSVNMMLTRDSVKNRLDGDGLSFTEFSYMLFQGNDFLELARRENCKLQIGGSDQFGNICCGLDLLRKNEFSGFGMTFPLLTKDDGSKFGKSESGAIWLDSTKTTPWDFFQFWMSVSDKDVIRFLKMFTFLTPFEILELEKQVKDHPELRLAQKQLAIAMTNLIHGDSVCETIQEVINVIFCADSFSISKEGFSLLETVINVSKETVKDLSSLKKIMVCTGLVSSNTQAHQAIKENSVTILPLNEVPFKVNLETKAFPSGSFLIKVGKKRISLKTV